MCMVHWVAYRELSLRAIGTTLRTLIRPLARIQLRVRHREVLTKDLTTAYTTRWRVIIKEERMGNGTHRNRAGPSFICHP